MKLPKETKRYCKHCGKQTAQTISIVKQRGRSTSHPMSRWSNSRVRSRGLRRGTGNQGRFSKPAIKSWKRKTKTTKRMTVMHTCKECKKSKMKKSSMRVSRIEIGEKVAK